MGMTNEKMYGSYSDADLNDWEKFPINANVLTSSAFGAWLLRRDERRDKAISKADYENRLKADLVAMLTDIQLEIEELDFFEGEEPINITQELMDEVKSWEYGKKDCYKVIQQKINALKSESEGKK